MLRRQLWLRALIGGVLCFCSLLPAEPLKGAPGLTEAELKAVFLLRLSQFVSWPDPDAGSTFCVDEASEVGGLLAQMIATDPKGREVRAMPSDAAAAGCDIVFSEIENQRLDSASLPVLRVSDQPGFAREGGMVELRRKGARMELVVNLGALNASGLKASSKLLRLSEVIGEDEDDA